MDDYISNLDPIEKLLFLYFLTNPSTEISGIYEIPLKTVATDTGIEKEMVLKILKRFSREKKIYYVNGWVAITNFIQHQNLNPSITKGIETALNNVPYEVLDRLGTDWVQTVESLADIKLNINKTNLIKTKGKESGEPRQTPRDKAIKFFEMVTEDGDELSAFIEKICSMSSAKSDIVRKEILKFTSHWTELDSLGRKQRWQKQEAFEVQRRLTTWLSRAGQWSQTKISKGKSVAL